MSASAHRVTRLLVIPSLCLVSTLVTSRSAFAQLDRVYPTTGAGVTGQVVNMSRDGLSVKVGDSTQDFAVDQIDKVTYEGDPGPLTRGRDLAIEGQYQSALEQLKTVDVKSLQREYSAGDALFYLAASQARLALAGQGDKGTAISALTNFAGKFPKSIHFYEAAELLGDLAIATGDFDKAPRYYGALASSSRPLIKVRAAYLVAMAKLRQGKAAEALPEFEKVVGVNADTAEAIRLNTLARAGRAVALAQTGKGKEALEVANQLVEELNPDDSEMAARIYNARGAANEAVGDQLSALLDYLHTQLLYSSVVDAHAEALSRLVILWPTVGQPEKAARARQELQTLYPGWGG